MSRIGIGLPPVKVEEIGVPIPATDIMEVCSFLWIHGELSEEAVILLMQASEHRSLLRKGLELNLDWDIGPIAGDFGMDRAY